MNRVPGAAIASDLSVVARGALSLAVIIGRKSLVHVTYFQHEHGHGSHVKLCLTECLSLDIQDLWKECNAKSNGEKSATKHRF